MLLEFPRRAARPLMTSPDCASYDKFVPRAIDGQQMLRIGWIRLQLLAQLEDLVINGACSRVGVIAPDFIQQHFTREHTVDIQRKELEQLELVRGENNRGTIAPGRHAL